MYSRDVTAKASEGFFKYLVNDGEKKAVKEESATGKFAQMLGDAFKDVNNTVNQSEQKMAELATGEKKDIHGTMIAMQKADVAVKTLSAFRNKIVSAYQEIARMQI